MNKPKMRHKKAAYRLYLRLFLSNSVFYEDALNQELTGMCRLLGKIAQVGHLGTGPGKDPITRRWVKWAIRLNRRRTKELLHQRAKASHSLLTPNS